MKQERINIRVSECLKGMIEYAASMDEKTMSEYITDLVKADILRRSYLQPSQGK